MALCRYQNVLRRLGASIYPTQLSVSSSSGSNPTLSTKPEVLACYKKVRRSCQTVFAGDDPTIKKMFVKARTEFDSKKDVTDEEEIKNLIQVAHQVEEYVRRSVVQAEINPETGNYALKITEDTHLEENAPFVGEGNYVDPKSRRKKKGKPPPCGQES